MSYEGPDTFISGLGTVRECIDCHALLAGGPTRCSSCAKLWVRAANSAFGAVEGAWWSLYWRSRPIRRVVDRVRRLLSESNAGGGP